MTKVNKKDVEGFKEHKKDSGSAGFQVALITQKIESLIGHLKINPKDKHSRKGLLGLVSQRKKLLKYLKLNKPETFEKICEKFKLKG